MFALGTSRIAIMTNVHPLEPCVHDVDQPRRSCCFCGAVLSLPAAALIKSLMCGMMCDVTFLFCRRCQSCQSQARHRRPLTGAKTWPAARRTAPSGASTAARRWRRPTRRRTRAPRARPAGGTPPRRRPRSRCAHMAAKPLAPALVARGTPQCRRPRSRFPPT